MLNKNLEKVCFKYSKSYMTFRLISFVSRISIFCTVTFKTEMLFSLSTSQEIKIYEKISALMQAKIKIEHHTRHVCGKLLIEAGRGF